MGRWCFRAGSVGRNAVANRRSLAGTGHVFTFPDGPAARGTPCSRPFARPRHADAKGACDRTRSTADTRSC